MKVVPGISPLGSDPGIFSENENRHRENTVPPIVEVDTPNCTFSETLDSQDESVASLYGSNIDEDESNVSQNDISAVNILKDIRIKNVNKLIIGTLNINFIAPKFEQLKEVIGNHLDILTIQETKVDKSFPDDQFEIEG